MNPTPWNYMIAIQPGAPGRQTRHENNDMADPKCPDCGESGIENIVSTPSKEQSRERRPWFYVAHCDNCGHVFGIFTKHVFGKSGPQLIVEGRK
jgi:hypothetical protein